MLVDVPENLGLSAAPNGARHHGMRPKIGDRYAIDTTPFTATWLAFMKLGRQA